MNSSSNNESHSRDQITRFSQRLNSEYRKMKRSTFTYLNNPPTNQSRIASLLEGCTELKSIIEILFKKVKDRTPFENKQLITYLLTKNLKQQFKDQLNEKFLTDDTFYKYLEHYISIHLLKKNDPIYLQGDKSDLLHFILHGNVSTFSLEKSNDVLTAVEYYEYLDDFTNNFPKDTFLLMKIIESNNDIYPVYSTSDIAGYKEILFKCKLRLYKEEGNKEKEEELLKERKAENEDEDEDEHSESKVQDEGELEKENYYYQRLKDYLHCEGKQLITKLTYKKENSFEIDDFFGNDNIIANFHTLTTKCMSEYVVIISINQKAFVSLVQNDYNAYREREREYLYASFFYKTLHRTKFITKVADVCNEIELTKYEVLLKQNEYLNKFYFTRYGTVQLYLEKTSVNDLKNLITLLKSLLPKRQLTNISIKENYTMDHSYKTIEKSMELKRKFLVLNTERSSFGECEFLYPQLKSCSLFTVNVISEKAKFYTFDYEKHLVLLSEFPKLNEELHKAVHLKLITLLERLISICNNYHRKINEEYNIKLKENKNKTPFQQYNTGKYNMTVSLMKSRNDILTNFVLKKNRLNYVSHDNDLYTELIEKNKNNQMLPHYKCNNNNSTKYNDMSDIVFTNYNNYSLNTSVEKQSSASNGQQNETEQRTFTLTKRDLDKYKSPKLCLPVIDNTKVKYDYMRKVIKNNILYSGNKIFKQAHIKLQNVPMMNQLKKKQNESKDEMNEKNQHNKKNKKVDFTIYAPKYKKEHDFKNIISSYPGGYYMAVHQFIDEKKKKFYEQ